MAFLAHRSLGALQRFSDREIGKRLTPEAARYNAMSLQAARLFVFRHIGRSGWLGFGPNGGSWERYGEIASEFYTDARRGATRPWRLRIFAERAAEMLLYGTSRHSKRANHRGDAPRPHQTCPAVDSSRHRWLGCGSWSPLTPWTIYHVSAIIEICSRRARSPQSKSRSSPRCSQRWERNHGFGSCSYFFRLIPTVWWLAKFSNNWTSQIQPFPITSTSSGMKTSSM
jgi:hypothetical protein